MLIYLQMIESDEDNKSKFEAIYEGYRGLMFHVAYERMKHIQNAKDTSHHTL